MKRFTVVIVIALAMIYFMAGCSSQLASSRVTNPNQYPNQCSSPLPPPDWNNLEEFCRFIESSFYQPDSIKESTLLYGALKGMIRGLDDPYSEFFDPDEWENWVKSRNGDYVGVGIQIAIKDSILTVISVFEGSPAEQAGLQANDQILKIDGEPTKGKTTAEASKKISGAIKTTVVLFVRHSDGCEEDILVTRDRIVIKGASGKLLQERIAYVHVHQFDPDVAFELDSILFLQFNLDSIDGIILDLRDNPGGLLPSAIDVSSRFVDEGIIVTTKGRDSEETIRSKGNIIPNLPLAILINNGTASAAEVTAGAIQDHKMGILIGQRSFGKGVIQHTFPCLNGSCVKITVGEYFTPAGNKVQGIGLTPDIQVAENEDPIEVAIKWIKARVGKSMPTAFENNDL